MAEKRDVTINLLLRGIEKLDSLSKNLDQGDKSLASWKRQLRDVSRLVKQVEESTSKINAGLAAAFKDRKHPPTLADIEREVRSGGPSTRMANAAARGRIAQFEATANQLFARLTSTYTRGFQRFVKAIEQETYLELTRSRQVTPSQDRKRLRQQIEAQEYRVADASRDPRFQHNLPSVRKGAQVTLDEERQALANLQQAYNRLLEAEQQLKRETQARANLLERIRQTQDKTLQPLQRELELRRMANELDKLNDPTYRAASDSVARARKIIGLERQSAWMSDPEVRDKTQEVRDQKRLEAIEAQRLRNYVRMEAAGKSLSELDRVNIRIKDRFLQLEKALIQSKGQTTAEVQKQFQRLQDIHAVKARILNTSRSLGRAEKQTTEQIIAQRTEMNRAMAQDSAFLKSSAALNRAQNWERVTGDGGAFLFGVQAQLLGNYMVMNKLFQLFRFGSQFVLQLDQAFHQLQAITATTSTEMAGLSDKLVEVSEKTKFTAVEVAEAAVTLGQAGFSTRQIEDSIEAVTLLATAVGSTLSEAVDLATSTLSVFNLRASEMSTVANILTASVNESKLTIDRIALGIQYAGNIAAEQGVTLTEFTAVLGAMANSGIRAGSTLGTGLRQLLISFTAPTAKMTEKMRDLGLTVEDLNVRTHGLAGVLRNLQRAGFTAADAMQVLEVRGGAAYAAVSRSIDMVEDLQSAFLLSNAAAEANVIQMDSLANKFAQAASVLGTFIMDLAGPLVKALKVTTDGFVSLVQWLNRFTGALQIAGTVIGALGFSLLINRLLKLASNLLLGETAFISFTKASKAAASSVGVLNKTLAVSRTMLATFWPAAVIMGVTALVSMVETADDAVETLDQMRAKVDEVTGHVEAASEAINSINDEIERLINRSDSLQGKQSALSRIALELTERFGDLGAEFDSNNGKVEDFIETLNNLRLKMLEVKEVELRGAIHARNFTIDEALRQAGRVTLDTPVSTGSPEWWLRNKYARFSHIIPEDLFGAVGRLGEATLSNKGAYGTPLDQQPDLPEVRETITSLQATRNNLVAILENVRRGLGAYANLTEEQRRNLEKDIRQNYIIPADRKIGLLSAAGSDQIKVETDLRRLATTQFDQDSTVANVRLTLQDQQKRLNDLRQEFGNVNTPEGMQMLIDEASAILGAVEEMDAWAEEYAKNFPNASYDSSQFNREVDKLIGSFISWIDDSDESRIELLKVRDKYQMQYLDRQQARLMRSIRSSEPVFPNVDPNIRSAIHAASASTGVDFTYLMAQAKRESDFKPDAANKDSTAVGLFQFLEGTWLEMMRKYGSRYGYKTDRSVDDRDLLALRTDARASSFMAAEYASENASFLRSRLGRAPSSADLYLAHFLGPGGAQKFLEAHARNPNVSAASLLPGSAASNESVFYGAGRRPRSLAEVYDWVIEQFTFDNSPSRIQETKEKFLQNFDRQTEILTRQLTDQLRQEHLLNTPVGRDALTHHAEARAEERARLEREFDRTLHGFDTAGQNVVDSLQKFAHRVSEVTKDLALARDANRAALRRAELQLEGMDMPGIRNRYSDVQRQAIRESMADLETQALQADLASLREAEVRLERLLEGLREEQTRFQKVEELAENTVRNYENRADLSITKEQYTEAANRAASARSSLNSAEREGVSITNQLKEVRKELAQTEQRVAARTGESLEAAYDFNKILSTAWRQWAEEQGFLMDSTARLGDGLKGVFSEVSGSLREFSKTALTTTGQVGDAFQAMAVRIVEAMFDIAMQEAASGLFGLVRDALPLGGGGASKPQLSSAPGSGAGGMAFTAGGFIRAALGRHIKTRDAVPVMAMDGEYILRKSAVDMLGREALDQVNALGNRTISRGVPSMMGRPEGDKTVNVYLVSPEQQPPPSKNDVILWISEDMINGGQTKKLVKSINMGTI